MSAQAILNSIDVVAGVLSFRIDDYEQVNEAFAAGAMYDTVDRRREIDVWTYCYVSRYFALQFLRAGHRSWSDLDRLIDRAFVKIRGGQSDLRIPGRYTSWVNTVCRNVYLNYVRSYRLEWLEDPESVVAESVDGETYDLGLLAATVSRVIEDLPPFLQEAARLRFFSGLTYREMSVRTGQPVPTLRAYANKSLKLIRKNPQLQRLFEEMGG